jgi:hypothetical protein
MSAEDKQLEEDKQLQKEFYSRRTGQVPLNEFDTRLLEYLSANADRYKRITKIPMDKLPHLMRPSSSVNSGLFNSRIAQIESAIASINSSEPSSEMPDPAGLIAMFRPRTTVDTYTKYLDDIVRYATAASASASAAIADINRVAVAADELKRSGDRTRSDIYMLQITAERVAQYTERAATDAAAAAAAMASHGGRRKTRGKSRRRR